MSESITTTLGADLATRITEAHGEAVTDAVRSHVEAGLTEKQAVAVALRDHGATNADVGEAFGPLFGSVTKPGGAGNVVTAGLRALGREGEITGGGGGGTKKVVVRDSKQLLRDEIDRAKSALDSVTKPVTEAEARLAEIDKDPDAVVAARVAEIDDAVKTLNAEKKVLGTDDGKTAFVDAARTSATTRRDAAKTASDENAARMTEAVASLEATLAVIEAM